MTQRLTYDEIQQRVQSHGFELVTTPQQWRESASPHVLVRSPSGYEQLRRVGAFVPGGLQVSCQYDRLGRKGETLAVLAASALTGVTLAREFTPQVLKGQGYRLDGWAKLRGPDGLPVYLALEHQGDHRRNPRAPVHLRRGGAEKSMSEQSRRDEDKARRLASDPRIVLVTIPDLMLATDREQGVIDIVADALEAKLGWLKHDAGYLVRKAQLLGRLAAGERVLRIPPSWKADAQQRVEAALAATGDQLRLRFVNADPMARTVTLACQVHGVLEPVNINNILGAVDGSRLGTRCRHCANAAHGDRRRLTDNEVEAAAKAAGFRPLFGPGAYLNNQQILDWQCLNDPAHEVRDSLAHLQVRGCPHCREEGRAQSRQASEFAEVSAALKERGDELLSTEAAYQDQTSRIRFRCGHCGDEASQSAAKIKRGQRHGCQRLAASQSTRRRREFDKLAEQVRGLGIELLTTADTYAGNRQPIQFREPGSAQTRTAPAYRLRAWADKVRTQRA